jgi:hypothetical protein
MVETFFVHWMNKLEGLYNLENFDEDATLGNNSDDHQGQSL